MVVDGERKASDYRVVDRQAKLTKVRLLDGSTGKVIYEDRKSTLCSEPRTS